jgi:hypothetical protein
VADYTFGGAGVDDWTKAAEAMAQAPVQQFTVKGTQQVADAVSQIGAINLAMRQGGGKYKRSVARVFSAESSEGWSAVLQTPWMGMEFGGLTTWIYGHGFGTDRKPKNGATIKPMWAPWHEDFAEGYIIGSAWVEMDRGTATKDVADAALAAYTMEFDKAGLKRG